MPHKMNWYVKDFTISLSLTVKNIQIFSSYLSLLCYQIHKGIMEKNGFECVRTLNKIMVSSMTVTELEIGRAALYSTGRY